MFHVPERWRMLSDPDSAACVGVNAGVFAIRYADVDLLCIAADGGGWEHVSVRVANSHRLPSWGEMCLVKGVFWDDEDAVMQLHPPASEYVNCHPFVLHLWRPALGKIPLPPKQFV